MNPSIILPIWIEWSFWIWGRLNAHIIKEISKKNNEKITDEMVECPTCKTYVSQKEAILSNGKFYYSKECLNNK